MEELYYEVWDIYPYIDIDTEIRRNTFNIASENYEIVLDMPHDIYRAEERICSIFCVNRADQNSTTEILEKDIVELLESKLLPEEVENVVSEVVTRYIAEEQMIEYEIEHGYRLQDESIPDEELFNNWRESSMYRDIMDQFLNE